MAASSEEIPGIGLPLLPTTVIGSYAYPSWLWTALEEMRQGKYGETDIAETLGDAVRMAILDQEEAGIDIINGRKRSYQWMLPQILDARAHQFVLEFASRELKELELCREFASRGEVGVGIVDVKSFHVETPEEIAARVRQATELVSPERLYVNPDCGFFHLPRGIAYQKMRNMVAGTRLVRREIEGAST
jgi:methionine synthase II (cobalamin-independent)